MADEEIPTFYELTTIMAVEATDEMFLNPRGDGLYLEAIKEVQKTSANGFGAVTIYTDGDEYSMDVRSTIHVLRPIPEG